jgi:hypothetical protein
VGKKAEHRAFGYEREQSGAAALGESRPRGRGVNARSDLGATRNLEMGDAVSKVLHPHDADEEEAHSTERVEGQGEEVDLEAQRQSARDRAEDRSIDAFVEGILSNKRLNCFFLPDFVERVIYRNVMRLIVGYFGTVVNSAEIRFANHKLSLSLEPVAPPGPPGAASPPPDA